MAASSPTIGCLWAKVQEQFTVGSANVPSEIKRLETKKQATYNLKVCLVLQMPLKTSPFWKDKIKFYSRCSVMFASTVTAVT